MARIVLITTGLMEAAAFHTSLQRIFPAHEFVARARMDSFTSAPLPPNYEQLREKRQWLSINEFANTLIGRLAGGRRDEPPADFVVGIEDLELCNAAVPENVTRSVRDAVAEQLGNWGDAAKQRHLSRALRDRCSFHLMAPMTEAYFFADSDALARATAPAPDRRSRFDPFTCDIEAFHVEDPEYLEPANVSRAERRQSRHDWRRGDRQRHPKCYLQYLTDPTLDGRGRYSETSHGRNALAELDWPTVVCNEDPIAARFARSMLADLVDMLGGPTRDLAEIEEGDCHRLTWPPPVGRVLRNL